MSARQGPPEPVGGQDDPPDLGAALRAAVKLLSDFRAELEPDVDAHRQDLRLRAAALRKVLRRLAEDHGGAP